MRAPVPLRKPLSFRRRVTLAAAAAVAVAIAFAAALTFILVRAQLHQEIDDSLESTARDLSKDRPVFFEPEGPAPATPEPLRRPGESSSVGPRRERSPRPRVVPAPGPVERAPLPRTGPEPLSRPDLEERLVLPAPPLTAEVRYAQLVTADGEVIRPPRARIDLPGRERAAELARSRGGSFFADGEVDGEPVRVFTRALEEGASLQVARPKGQVEDTLRRLATILGLVTLGGVGLGAALAQVVTRASLKPVAELNATAQHVARTRDLSRRIGVTSPDELGGLAKSFDAMLEALEHSMRQQRQLVADASHELRTPLTSLRTNVEVLARGSAMSPEDRQRLLSDVIGQLEELTVLVGDLVDLAREEEDEPIRDVRLDRLVEDVVARARCRHPQREFRLDVLPTLVPGSAARLDRAVANLIDNAEKWSPPGEPIEIRVRDGEVSVRDHGPGIDDSDLPFIFDRFYRAAAARGTPGSGLGLAIVKHVADTHEGEVVARPAEDGGTVLVLRIPGAASGHGSGADGFQQVSAGEVAGREQSPPLRVP